MTNQEAFDRVATHLLTQKSRAVYDSTCVYRSTLDGKSCAIGCLISDEEYAPSMELRGVKSLLLNFPKLAIHSVSSRLLKELQHLHDGGAVAFWKGELRNIGNRYNLDTAVLDRAF